MRAPVRDSAASKSKVSITMASPHLVQKPSCELPRPTRCMPAAFAASAAASYSYHKTRVRSHHTSDSIHGAFKEKTHTVHQTDTHRLRFLVMLNTPCQPGCSVKRLCRFAVLARRL